jgi:hypothetical protein
MVHFYLLLRNFHFKEILILSVTYISSGQIRPVNGPFLFNSNTDSLTIFRFGDMLNPWGDLIAMARAWCLVKPGGKALVGVPSGPGMNFGLILIITFFQILLDF